MPFLLSDPEQISEKFVKQKNILLEATIFDAVELFELIKSKKFSSLLKKAKQKGEIKAFHFPTENANYISSTKLKKLLFQTIKELEKHSIPHLILHTNYIQKRNEFNAKNLLSVRQRYLSFFKKLGAFAKKRNVIVCIENLPIIGNKGDDFDSVFVFPKDFKEINIPGVKIAWDLGHWVYTCQAYTDFSKYYQNLRQPNIDDFLALKNNIRHLHFSSFKNKVLKKQKVCEEGIIPQAGDYNQIILAKLCKKIHALPQELAMTLEIKEQSYHNRPNLKKTIRWFESKVF